MKYHLIGAGGAGMSVVGQLLVESGHEVTGSDRADGKNLRLLEQAGATVFVGHDAAQVPPDAVVVVSSAIKDANPELQVARERGQEVIHRSQALALAAASKQFVAVAGAHGKSSTSAMLAVALEKLGRDPSRAIGANLAAGASGAHLGKGDVFVAEADESDGSFLNYSPRIAIVTNIEADHLDHYGTVEAFEHAFYEFAKRIEFGGLLICCADSPAALELARKARESGIRTWTYGRGEGLEHHGRLEGNTVYFRGKPIELRLAVPGAHNQLNAAGALLSGIELGEDPQRMADALGQFTGTGRRFELRGQAGGRTVVDDYAHHPTEVRATLRTARAVVEGREQLRGFEASAGGRVIVLFQPHLYSRTQIFAQEFADALQLADVVVLTSVYPAREVPADGAEANVIAERLPGAHFVPDAQEAAREIARLSRPGDLILTMGAGDVTQLGPVILSEL